jgi:hypothetical protein
MTNGALHLPVGCAETYSGQSGYCQALSHHVRGKANHPTWVAGRRRADERS